MSFFLSHYCLRKTLKILAVTCNPSNTIRFINLQSQHFSLSFYNYLTNVIAFCKICVSPLWYKMTLLTVVTSQKCWIWLGRRMCDKCLLHIVYIFKRILQSLAAAAAIFRVICCFKHNSNDVFIPESHLVSDYSLCCLGFQSLLFPNVLFQTII